ncbi:MAG: L-histidine N(alpha)-methyltransferase [Bacteroidota bacterium]
MDKEKTTSTFAQDVLDGLRANPKYLSSKYFYDAKGSELFQQIMRMPAYYLTDCEFEVFENNRNDILEAFAPDGSPFRLVEFGAGDGLKTKVLLSHFLDQQAAFTYTPIDISGDALHNLHQSLAHEWPELKVDPIEAEYFAALQQLQKQSNERKVVLFLGSNLGNFPLHNSVGFLQKLGNFLNPGDLLLIGLDLKKDPEVILEAYNDKEGITREFNLNLLRRMNRELGADFVIDQFMHWPTYNPMNGETRSFLISRQEQDVYFSELGERVHFRAWEAIWMELSQKYDRPLIKQLAEKSGFQVVSEYTDSRGYFVDSLWEKR